jgi:hypothetical protein
MQQCKAAVRSDTDPRIGLGHRCGDHRLGEFTVYYRPRSVARHRSG